MSFAISGGVGRGRWRWRGRRGGRRAGCACRGWRTSGQATVEAAFALPILMLLVLLLLQPGIILYDRIVMKSAASEACRLLATSSDGGSRINDDYIRRRLGAIPQIDQFHVHSGGCSWNIVIRGDERADTVEVVISNEVKPLPLLDLGMRLLHATNHKGNLEIEVSSKNALKSMYGDRSLDGDNPSRWPGI